MSEINYKYAVGEHIEVRDPTSGQWREAWIEKLAPQHFRGGRSTPGYYIYWVFPKGKPRESWVSAGGWTYEACMRPLQPVDDLEIAATLKIDIWTKGRKLLPNDLSALAEKFSPHLEHVKTLCEQGYQAGEIVDDDFSGWWTIETA